MESFLKGLVEGFVGPMAYLGIFAILVACGLGVPLPEDISLILGGYLAGRGQADLGLMMFTGFAGILVGDSVIFAIGRRYGSRIGRSPGKGFFGRIVTPEKRLKVEQMFAKHGEKVVCAARFMPGVRAVTFFTAGSAGMKYSHFIFWDGLAALLSAPVFVYGGYYFAENLERLISGLKRGQAWVFGSLAVVAVAWFLWSRIRKRRLAAEAARAVVTGKVPPPPHFDRQADASK